MSVSENITTETPAVNILESVEKQNITNKNFFIQKAEVEVISGNENQKMLASIKFNFPERYLISLRSRTGIEVARIFITEDTVLINDRFNKKTYFGDPEKIEKNYGISPKLLPVILGDLIKGKEKSFENVQCDDNKADIDVNFDGKKINYLIDCKKMKIISASQEVSIKTKYAGIQYENFVKAGNGLIPTKISIDFNDFNVVIKIEKIETPWNGTIEFVPGSRYDLIELL